MARPSGFKQEYIEQAAKLANLGATDQEIADFFKVDRSTLFRWRNSNEKLCNALKAGKEQLDARVETSLFHRAIGFERDAVKIFLSKSGETVYAKYREFVPPDTTACIFWLKNRKPKEWRDKIETSMTGEDGGPIRIIADL